MTEMPEEIWVDSCDWFYIKPLLGRTTCSYRLKSTVDADIAKAEAKIIELWDADISDHNKVIRELAEVLRDLDRYGGFGYERHGWITQVLSDNTTRIAEAQEKKT